jgi:hypothetical protein
MTAAAATSQRPGARLPLRPNRGIAGQRQLTLWRTNLHEALNGNARYRWGQSNITEKDSVRYDIGWWRARWKRTRVQGATINGGGIVADYPSKYPMQGGANFLGDRDLYGELAKAAHDDGLAVAARMDSNRTSEVFLARRIPTGSPEIPAAIRIARRISTTGVSTGRITTSISPLF